MAALLFVATTSLGFANAVADIPLGEKVALSDVVILGRVISGPIPAERHRSEAEFATVVVEKILKGAPPNKIMVMTKDTIAEFNPDCCKMGKRYLFFLQKLKGGQYASTNGRFGIIALISE